MILNVMFGKNMGIVALTQTPLPCNSLSYITY